MASIVNRFLHQNHISKDALEQTVYSSTHKQFNLLQCHKYSRHTCTVQYNIAKYIESLIVAMLKPEVSHTGCTNMP